MTTEKGIKLLLTDRFKAKATSSIVVIFLDARSQVVDEGFNPVYGARPLRRAITRLLEELKAA